MGYKLEMIKINLGWFIGFALAMYMAHKMWGSTGMWFTFGLSLQTSKIYLKLGRGIS